MATVVYPAMPGIRPDAITVTSSGKVISDYAGDLLTAAEVTLAIDAASTVKLTFTDPTRKLLASPLLNQSVTIDTGASPARRFTLVQVAKQANDVACTFEDSLINKLRQQKGQLAAAGGVVTREQFVAQLCSAAGVPSHVASGEASATIALTRGSTQTPTEDSWSCITRLAQDVAYRAFSDGQQVWFGPDSWLFAQPVAMHLAEFTDQVDFIDFDYDVGKPLGTAKVTGYADTWTAPIGARVSVQKLAAATGDWLVSQIARDLFLKPTTVTLIQPQPEIPEPPPQTTTTTGSSKSSSSTG